LRVAEVVLEEIAHGYEVGTAASIYPHVLGHRRWVEDLLEGHQPLKHRASLLAIAGQLSGLLGYLAFDVGNRPLAYAYCEEALRIAQEVGNNDLSAWVRGTQSFIAYYSGRYEDALELARDGQRYAHGSPQAVRLAASGEARALGQLGDRSGVDEAVERAVSLGSECPEGDGVGYFLSLGPMGIGRVYGNAASAYLALGQGDATQQLAAVALDYFQEVDTARASTALTIVDVSMSHLLTTKTAAPEEAGRLMRCALCAECWLDTSIFDCRRPSKEVSRYGVPLVQRP
jgi:tetratricopeptide (TPR) repeat protein